jgi:D-alanyl-D-alanine carboxypeptidase/D-alanyl-D-alanine-endopeptidase (penicillin-binding protein 4)
MLMLLAGLLVSCSVSKKIGRELEKEEASREDLRGFVVFDPARDKELINYNGIKYFIPASTVKLFTFYTAYMTLPDSVPSIEYLEKGDSLFIRGTADPLVLVDDDDRVVKFLKNREEKVFLIDRSIDDDVYGPGWSWEDFTEEFMPERSMLPLYGNRVSISRVGDHLEIVPELFAGEVEDQEYGGVSMRKTNKARDAFRNHFYVESLAEDKELQVPFVTSNQLAADLLSQAIDRKITLYAELENEVFKKLRTRPYDSLYTSMLIDSDNFIAEQLMLQVGYATDSVYRVKTGIDHALKELLVGIPQRPKWVDGSGLSRYNLFTPESVVFLLKKLYREIPADKLMGYLAVGGVSGTLKGNYAGKDEKPFVFAKSGTLSNNYCLSGFLKTKRGKILLFSFMDNHYLGSSGDRKVEISRILERLRESY